VAPTSDRIEAAIEKLTNVSVELKQMLAIHELRISNQEKTSDNLQTVVEKRREELDLHLNKVYETMREQDEKVLSEVKSIREEHNKHYTCLNEKITALQKYLWIAIGGGIVVTWILTNLANYLRLLH
jgi:gas vesicle protein